MRYLGGKFRISKDIVRFLESERTPGQLYVEPFLGGCNLLPKMAGPKWGSDINLDLILFYQALALGWVPPTDISETQYQTLKVSEPSALRGFVGANCSFSGKWFGGYARSGGRNYALNAQRSALRIVDGLKGATLYPADYATLIIPPGSLVYCDPPYAGVTGYGHKFDHAKFWDWVVVVSRHSKVFVSEYSAPPAFVESLAISRNLEMAKGRRVERIFTYDRIWDYL